MPQSLHVVETRGLVLDWQVVRDPEISMLSMLFMGGSLKMGVLRGTRGYMRLQAYGVIWWYLYLGLYRALFWGRNTIMVSGDVAVDN